MYIKLIFRTEWVILQLIQTERNSVYEAEVVHDLSLARAYGTQALLLYDKHVLAQGSVDRVFDPAHLNTAYGMDVAEWMRTMLGQWS